jgi:capsular exopolysaccharide synthesis family protein
MTQDERLVPARAGRDLDSTLAELTQGKPYGRYGGSAPAETNLREYLFVVLKRKWLIMSLILVITSLATIQAYRDPSVFEGATTIRIEPKVNVLSQGNLVISSQPDPNFWGTQLKLLQNPELARQVVLTLGLKNNPAFLGGEARSGVFDSLKRIFSPDKPITTTPSNSGTADPVSIGDLKDRQFTPEESAQLEPYEDAIAANLTVEPTINTNLVIIHYRHTDPELAKKIADTLADVFIDNNNYRITSGRSEAELKLVKTLAETQTKINQQEKDRFAFAKAHNLPLDNRPGSDLEAMRLSTYSGQLLEAENQRRSYIATYEAARNAPDFSAPEIQSDQRIMNLRQRLGELKEKRQALLESYTKEWPAVKQVEAQIKPLEEELVRAPKEVFASLKSRADGADARVRSLTKAYQRQHGTTTQQTKDQIELAVITSELEANKQLLNTLTARLRELSLAGGGSSPSDVTVSTYSRVPRGPVGPARLRTIVLAFILSLVAGIGLAFLLEFLDDTIKSVADVDRHIHLPALALIPAGGGDKPRLRGSEPAQPRYTTALALVRDVRSPIAEAYRHLRTSLLLSSAGNPPRTILVTSSQPSEGKTTTAINTAFMLAQTGAKVLIIDCDLRRPRLHAHFNVPNTRGLTNCLSGEMDDLDSLIQTYEGQPNLKILPSGPVPPNPAELLGSDEMRRLLTTLSEKYNHIIVDSPPAISFTDASILSTFVDGVILVIHGGRSSRAVVRRAKQQLLDVGAHIFGVVLNNVKIESHDYYYAGYYKSDSYGDDDAGADKGASEASS